MPRAALAFTLAAAGALTLGGCANAPRDTATAPLTAEQSEKLAKLIGDRVAREPVTCLPPGMRSASSTGISPGVLAYQQGGGPVYVNNLRGTCPGIQSNWDVIVTDQFQGRSCSGDIIRLVDRTTGMFRGSCALGDFTPYVRPDDQG